MTPAASSFATPKFFYFDLGNVLLHFDHERGCQLMGEVAGLSAKLVRQMLYDSGWAWRYEAGEFSDEEFFELFCRETNTRPDRARLLAAAGDIFEVNASIVPVVASLKRAGHRLGILSNTCSPHWEHCANGRYDFFDHFDVPALSYVLKACKPDRAIYDAAQKLAGVAPHEIFFVDDLPQNVAGAREAGFDAVLYTSTPELIADLQRRGVAVNPDSESA